MSRFMLRCVMLGVLAMTAALPQAVAASESHGAPGISGLTLNTPRVERYRKLEMSFHVALQVDNPYDPDEIDVRAVIQTPSGKKVFVPAFYYQGFAREADKDGGEKL